MPWSDWQPGFTLTASVSAAAGSLLADHADSSSYPSDTSPLADFDVLFGRSMNNLMTAATAVAGGPVAGALFAAEAARTPPTPVSAPTGDTGISLDMDQQSVSWFATPYNPFPAPLNDLVEGVDYATAPDSASAYEYESLDPASHSWPATMPFETGGRYEPAPFGSATSIDIPHTTIRIDVLDGPVPDGFDSGIYGSRIATGTQIASVLVRADDGDPEPGASGFDGTYGNVHTLALPSDLGISFTLMAVAEMAAVLVPEPPPQFFSVGKWDSNAGPQFGTGGIVGGYGWTVGFAFGDDSGTALDFTWTTSRWRYWIPDTGPALKTVGENFLSGAGQIEQIKSLIPGYGWLPVRRHG